MEQHTDPPKSSGMNSTLIRKHLHVLSLNENTNFISPSPTKTFMSPTPTHSLSPSFLAPSLTDPPPPTKPDPRISPTSFHFHLKSRDIPASIKQKIHPKGLGANPIIPSKGRGRGRPSHLSEAQSKALRDKASGKQKISLGNLERCIP